MANHSSGSGGSDETADQRRRRGAPTIDLKATELPASEPGQEPVAEPVAEPAPAPAVADAPPAPPAEAVAPSQDTAEAAPMTAAAETPPAETGPDAGPSAPAPEAASPEVAPDADATAPPREPPGPAQIPPPPSRRGQPWLAAAAGALGALFVLMVSGLLVYLFMPQEDLGARIAQTERGLADLAKRPPVVPPVLADLPARLAKIEQVVSAEPTVTQRLADLGKRGEATAAAITETQKRLDAANKAIGDLSRESALEMLRVDRAAIAGLHARLGTQDTTLKAQQEEIAKLEKLVALADPAAVRAVRFALLAENLKATVERGAPYAAELAALRPLTDAKTLEPLVPFAATGLPSPAALAAEFAALTPKIVPKPQDPAPATSAAGFLEKLQANAERLVKLRPAGEASGDDVAAVAARIAAKAGRGDLAGALADAQKLPADAKAAAEPWIKKAQTREAARASAHAVVQTSLAAVARGASQGTAP